MRRHLATVPLLLAAALAAPAATVVAPSEALAPLATTASAPPTLLAGAATVDITPRLGGTTLGYVRPDIAVDGVHTRLTGRALVLDDGGTEVVLLATDLGFPLDKDSLIARIADLGFTHETVLYTGTHTHSGPEELADWQVEQLADAVRAAHAAKRPATAAWASTQVADVNRNRSIEAHLANHGQDLIYGAGHPDDDPQGVDHTVDETLRVLRVDGLGGDPLAAWVEFPVHLTASTPYNTLWDTEIAGPTLEHLAQRVDAPGFVGLYANGASGDLQPRFDAWNPQVLMDRHGSRLAAGAYAAWRRAGRDLDPAMPVDVRWTNVCYCGQEVGQGRSVGATPIFGLPFLGGSEDGASIFHEPVATEGRRLPAALADPVQGRKIPVVPSAPLDVHDGTPEVQVLRLGDRVLLAAPGEPSVEMGRRFVAAVRPLLPEGVREAFLVGLANGYLGYLVTPQEYDAQHYEGGHTVFGKWTSLLTRSAFRDLTRALASGEDAPEPAEPPVLGGTTPGTPDVGDGGVEGVLTAQPRGTVERHGLVDLAWTGAAQGADRPLDTPFLVLERDAGDRWRRVADDLGTRWVWQQSGSDYAARFDVPWDLRAGTHRVRVLSGSYTLTTERFRIAPTDDLRLLGARRAGDMVVVRAQNPRPDADRSVAWRPVSPIGGTLRILLDGRERVARYDAARGGWVLPAQGLRDGDVLRVPAGGLVDGAGNRSGAATTLTIGRVRRPDWPDHMGVGGGRSPGVGGEGSFPP